MARFGPGRSIRQPTRYSGGDGCGEKRRRQQRRGHRRGRRWWKQESVEEELQQLYCSRCVPGR
jgi:hypothetical protein